MLFVYEITLPALSQPILRNILTLWPSRLFQNKYARAFTADFSTSINLGIRNQIVHVLQP